MAIAGLGLGSLAMVGGTAIGGDVGPLAVGYGLLVVLSALYLVAGLRRAFSAVADPDPRIRLVNERSRHAPALAADEDEQATGQIRLAELHRVV